MRSRNRLWRCSSVTARFLTTRARSEAFDCSNLASHIPESTEPFASAVLACMNEDSCAPMLAFPASTVWSSATDASSALDADPAPTAPTAGATATAPPTATNRTTNAA
jgi:hypothetical protein